MTGAFFGIPGALLTIFLGSLAGSVLGISMMIIGGRKLSQPLPFGPYLALGTYLFIFIDGDTMLAMQQSIVTLIGAK
jgi:leader peptidase (prepilin peptidase)/N-methyltransferase